MSKNRQGRFWSFFQKISYSHIFSFLINNSIDKKSIKIIQNESYLMIKCLLLMSKCVLKGL